VDIARAVEDGVQAAQLVSDVGRLVGHLTTSLRRDTSGIEYPEFRLKSAENLVEFNTGIKVKSGIFTGSHLKLNIPAPDKARMYSLSPYRPLDGAVEVTPSGVSVNRSKVEGYGESFRLELEYTLSGPNALAGLVYTSSPAETISVGGGDVQRYWLHSELKTLKSLKEIYERVRVEDVDVRVDVTLRDDINNVIPEDVRFEMMMMARLSSSDRNVSSTAAAYRRRHPVPRFRGNLFQVTQEMMELCQPSKFRKFLTLEGPYRMAKCNRSAALADIYLPVSVPHAMEVYSKTDLTLEEPAKDGKLIYKKSDFLNQLEKIIKD
jgi:hypothetical protein